MTDVAGGLITLEFALTGLNYTGTVAARDADVTAYIQAATPIIESLTGPLLSATVTRRFNGGKSGILLNDRIGSAASVTAVRVDGTAVTGFTVDAASGIIYASNSVPFNGGFNNVEVDLSVGMATIPPALQMAARELVVAMVQGGKQGPITPFDIAGGGDTFTPDDFLIPRRVRQLCAPYRQAGFA